MRKIIVSQVGSRHRYIIPKLLDDLGMLSALYTDSTCYSFAGRLSAIALKLGFSSLGLKRLAARKPLLAKKKIYTTDLLFFKLLFVKFFSKDKDYVHKKVYYTGLGKKFISWGVRDAGYVYNMYIENIDFLRYCKAKGLKVIIDIYETPMTYKYLIDEINEYPEIEAFQEYIKPYNDHHKIRMAYMEEVLELADYYTIPSKFVIKSLDVFKNFDASKAHLIPYPASLNADVYDYRPKPYKIIWVGGDSLRKGLIYCAKAADILKLKYPQLDFRVIGESNPEIINSKSFSSLNFIGVLNKEQLQEEYKSAQAYVFPTLFEGFAGTVIEAASFGCPIITTERAGTDMDVFPAIYIPAKNVEEIVMAVTKIFEDQSFRDTLSQQTYEYSKNLNPKIYAEELKNFFNSI